MNDPGPVIPSIDVSRLRTSPTDRGTARALVAASHGIGFCYLHGHGIPATLEQRALTIAREFFALSAAAKRALAIGNSPHFRGYTPYGHEHTKGQPDWREQLDLGLDEPTERAAATDPAWRRLRGPNQWPAELPEMRAVIGAWMAAMQTFALDVLRSLAIGLGQLGSYFDDCMLPRGDPHLKVIRYRGMDAQSVAAQGVGWHHDSGLLTFVLQDGAAGLEARTREGSVALEPRPGTYVMNLGEMLQRATAGYLRATEHRVVNPPPGLERISLAYFAHPKLESSFEPITLPPELAARAPGGDNADPNDPVFRCFGDNYLKIRLRSHPDVAARHYADVLPPSAVGH